MDIGESSWVLSMKSLWRSLNRVGIWKRIINDKYLKNQSLVTWIKDGAGVPGAISYIWRRKMKIKHWLLGNLKWHIGSIFGVDTGLDPIYGFVGEHTLPFPLIQHLHNLGIYYINQLQVPTSPFILHPMWPGLWDLGLFGTLAMAWDIYVYNLNRTAIFLSDCEDIYSWDGNTLPGQVLVEEAYLHITSTSPFSMSKRWFKKVWSWNIPLKLK